jgi:hypothetical protein
MTLMKTLNYKSSNYPLIFCLLSWSGDLANSYYKLGFPALKSHHWYGAFIKLSSLLELVEVTLNGLTIKIHIAYMVFLILPISWYQKNSD